MRNINRFYILVMVALLPSLLCAQTQKKDDQDRFVRLMSAQTVSNVEKDGKVIRQAEGPARFLHNNTWLICDTSYWDVDEKIIYAYGNVSIEQENTELRSDKLTYYINEDLAQFRGNLVELVDKDGNVLRTHDLDYNTKDSVAVFRNGAAMKGKDGQIIESMSGSYDAKEELFTFQNTVNMFSDSVFVKTTLLNYYSQQSLAVFPNYVNAWQEDRMLSGSKGWYNNSSEVFYLDGNVHTMDTEKEGWCDSLYFYKAPKILEMFSNVQFTDTTNNVSSLADKVLYVDSLSKVTLTRDPLLIMTMEEKDAEGVAQLDTVYMRGDVISMWQLMRLQVDSLAFAESDARRESLADDPVANIRARAAEEAAKKRQEALDNDPDVPIEQKSPEAQEKLRKSRGGNAAAPSADAAKASAGEDKDSPEKNENGSSADAVAVSALPSAADTLGVADSSAVVPALDTLGPVAGGVIDSLGVTGVDVAVDTLGVADSLALSALPVYTAADSVKLSFLRATGDIRVYRSTMQMVCDSLEYSGLDSLARLYKNPLVWNSPEHQYSSDSLFVFVRNGGMERAHLLSNAFIHIEESERFYDQIKATEMTAFFDADGQLARFDALGGASALFFMKEKDEIATANKSEATVLTADFENGNVTRISYFEKPQSSAYPVPQLKKEDQKLKGFNWTPDRRPKDRFAISTRTVRTTERKRYAQESRPFFMQTAKYFKGYMEGIIKEISMREVLKKQREEEEQMRKWEEQQRDTLDHGGLQAAVDSIAFAGGDDHADSLAVVAPVVEPVDTLASAVHPDSLSVSPVLPVSDTLDTSGLSDEELRKLEQEKKVAAKKAAKEAKQAEREAKRQAAIEKREAKWQELDMRDALKQAAKDAKKRERKEAKLKKQIKRLEKEKAREEAILLKYRQKYLKKVLQSK